MSTTVGLTFYGIVEEHYADDPNYEFIRPESFGYTGGQEVQGHLTLSGAAADAYDAAGAKGTATFDVAGDVTMTFPLPFFGDRQEDDIDSVSATPRLTLTRNGSLRPLADVSAYLYETDEADPVNGALGAKLGGAVFSTDDDERAVIEGVWVPDGSAITRSILSNDAQNETLTFDKVALVWAKGGNDVLRVVAPQAIVFGGQGDDTIVGGLGEDQLFGGQGDDALNGGANRDYLYGGDGSDLLEGGEGLDHLYGGEGVDRLVGGAGADVLDGGAGSDTADYRNAPVDPSGYGVWVSLETGRGQKSYAQGDVLIGIENLTGSAFADRLIGNAEANRIIGGNGNDRINGKAGADKLYGGEGNDVLDGGQDAVQDRLEGGGGKDIFVFRSQVKFGGVAVASTFGNDRIVDFQQGVDKAYIYGNGIGFGDLRFEAFTSGTGESGTRAYLNGGSIFFEGIAPGALTSADFQFMSV